MLLALTSIDLLAGVLSFHAAVTIGILILFSRQREKIAKLEEWVRLYEKRLNGEG